jgi:Rhs element Vgr protein
MNINATTVTLVSEGRRLDNTLPLIQLNVLKELNRVPSAHLVFADGSISDRRFALSQSEHFNPGKTIEILIRRENTPGQGDSRLFKGIVTGQTIEAGEQGFQLTVELKDKAVRLCAARRSAVYRDQKDSQVFSDLIRLHGLEEGEMADTKPAHPEIVQYDSSDWDFLLLRAEANGLVVSVSDGRVSVARPEAAGSARHRFEFGMSPILALELRADAERQFGAVRAGAWSIDDQALPDPEEAGNYPLTQGAHALNPADLADRVGADENLLATAAARPPAEMKAWADGRLMRSRLALHRGWLTVIGRADIKVPDTIELLGLSDKFNGRALVTGIRQTYGPAGWQTDLQIGLSEEPFAREHPDVHTLPAGGLLPAIHGLHIGVVDTFESDPENHYRVRVRVPAWQVQQEVIWARQLHPDAGEQRGIFFYPEPGDEVVLGFVNNDPREAVILGSLYSSSRPALVAANELDENNHIKGILTREGIEIRFDDEQKTLSIKTIDDQTVILNGNDKTITLEDGNNNRIILNDSGIQLKSGGDIKIEASGKVEIKGSEVNLL